MEVEDLKKYPILTGLQISDFAKIYIIGDTAVILNDDGYIYGTGRNQGHLISGQGNTFDKYPLTKIASPTGKKFKDIVTKGKHVLAITQEGFLYSWGSKTDDVLGHFNGNKIAQVQHVHGIRINKIACGNTFSVVLTMEGQLYEWGSFGLKTLELECRDDNVKSEDQSSKEKDKVQCICAAVYPIILSKKGKVYVPMLPRYKNSASSLHLEKLYPIEGPLGNKNVVQILEGNDYAFSLTDGGEIYYWEISDDVITVPKKLNVSIGRPIQLWATPNSNIIVAANTYGDLYSVCWPAGGKHYSTSPLNFYSAGQYFFEIGIDFSGPAYVKQTVTSEEEISEIEAKWKENFQSALNEEESSDVTFHLGEKVIYAHKAIVSTQSAYLETLIRNNWSEKKRDVIINTYTYPAFLRYLQFLYSGKLEFGSHEENLQLLQLAHEYMESDLLKLCEKQVLKGLLVENAISVYEIADKLDLPKLLRNCKLFMSKHLEEFREELQGKDSGVVVNFFRDMILSGLIQPK